MTRNGCGCRCANSTSLTLHDCYKVRQFDEFDADGSGRLTHEDLMLWHETQATKLEAEVCGYVRYARFVGYARYTALCGCMGKI